MTRRYTLRASAPTPWEEGPAIVGLDHPTVRSYLARLEAASSALPAGRATGLRDEVEAHLSEALSGTDGSEEALAGILDELGPPERLVAEVGGDAGRAHPGADAPGPRPRLEVLALALLVASVVCALSVILLPLSPVPWLVGSVLVLFSARWSAGDKALALLSYGILGVPLLFFSLTGPGAGGWSGSCEGGSTPDGTAWEACSGGPPSWWWAAVGTAVLLLLAAWVGTALRLARAMRRPEDHRRLLRMG